MKVKAPLGRGSLERKGSFFGDLLGEVNAEGEVGVRDRFSREGGPVCQQLKEGIRCVHRRGVTESLPPPGGPEPARSCRGLLIRLGLEGQGFDDQREIA